MLSVFDSFSSWLKAMSEQSESNGGEGGIRTHAPGFYPDNGLANHRHRPLGHLSKFCPSINSGHSTRWPAMSEEQRDESNGGGWRIRTSDPREGKLVFKTSAINHSANPPTHSQILPVFTLKNKPKSGIFDLCAHSSMDRASACGAEG